jgi:NAD(P)-dependent dehydrogenase (short-subunit alcohol dehydrogenase family)
MAHVLLIGGTGGIGSALSETLTELGHSVRTVSRRNDGFDFLKPETIDPLLQTLDGPFDKIIIATGALTINGAQPEKSMTALDAQSMSDQFTVNAIGPAMVLKHAKRLLPRDRPSLVCALSARVGSIGDNSLGGWYSYRAAKSALNQIVRTTAIELSRTHKHSVCVALHPGTVATEFTRKYAGRHSTVTPDAAAHNLIEVMQSLNPTQTGQFFDWAGKSIPW